MSVLPLHRQISRTISGIACDIEFEIKRDHVTGDEYVEIVAWPTAQSNARWAADDDSTWDGEPVWEDYPSGRMTFAEVEAHVDAYAPVSKPRFPKAA